MLDSDPFPILCRRCAAKFSETVGNLRAGQVATCPRCATPHVQPLQSLEWMLSEKGKPDLDQYLSRFGNGKT